MLKLRCTLRRSLLWAFLMVFPLMAFNGCTVHPAGEAEERHAALKAGEAFEKGASTSDPAVAGSSYRRDLVKYALLANAELEQKYWEWRSAIEQIPQDGTQPTHLALSASLNVMRGSTGLPQAIVGAGNDPMADMVLPPKLSTAAQRAMENARAAGLRFRKAQFDVRGKVLDAWFDYALTAELTRLQQSNAELLKTTARVTESRNSAGSAGQQDVLKAAQ